MMQQYGTYFGEMCILGTEKYSGDNDETICSNYLRKPGKTPILIARYSLSAERGSIRAQTVCWQQMLRNECKHAETNFSRALGLFYFRLGFGTTYRKTEGSSQRERPL